MSDLSEQSTDSGYTPIGSLNIKDLMSNLGGNDDGNGFETMIEQMVPGGINEIQKMLDNLADVNVKKEESQKRFDKIVEESEQKINGNSTINDLGSFLVNIQKTLSEDEEFKNTVNEFKENLAKAFKTPDNK